MKVKTQFARNTGGQYVAYQVCGSGDMDIVFIPDWCTNLDAMWEEPTLERFLNRLASMGRLICFDKRGTGVSDPIPLGAIPTFDGPARGVRCALAIRDAVRALGVEIRAGVHTGECEVMAEKVGGIAVHIGARVMGQARPGEVLVSRTVRDLVAGSGLEFVDSGHHRLKGVADEWRLFSAS